jgi:glycosyltransferase involved in cell wall biosynthesis
MLKVAAFTGSATISSRRFRLLQYVSALANSGVFVDEFVASYGSWPPASHWIRPLWLMATLADRISPVIRSHRYNLIFLQRELVSTMYTLERFTGNPRVLDVDDAVWLNGTRAMRSFGSLASLCHGVICGNEFIAQEVSRWNKNIIVLPTAVDTERFNTSLRTDTNKLIIGWSGLYAGSKYLLGIEDALHCVLTARPKSVLRVVSDAPPNFRKLSPDRVEFIQWSPENEVKTIQEMDIGLMPIDDSEWSKGKCSYKMLLYMSCGKPVVVSPYGMNKEVLAQGDIGFGSCSKKQWIDGIITLLDNDLIRAVAGQNARAIVEQTYSLKKIAPRLANFLQGVHNSYS